MQNLRSRGDVRRDQIKTALLLLGIALLIFFCWDTALELIRLVFGGAIIAFLILPLTKLLEKSIKRPLAALIAPVGVCALLIGLIALLLPVMLRQLSALMEYVPPAFMRLQQLVEGLAERLMRRLPDIALPKLDFAGAGASMTDFAKGAALYLGNIGTQTYRFALMVVLSYFLMADREQLLLRLELLIPERARQLTVRCGNTLLRELRLYLKGQLTIALAVGALAALGLVLLGIPSGVLLGAFVGIFNIIPYLGPIIGGIPAVLTALSLSWQRSLFTIGLLFLVQQIDGLVISPRVMGSITGFSPAIVLLALYLGGRLGGIAGLLFALPALMTVRTLYRVFVQRYEKN